MVFFYEGFSLLQWATASEKNNAGFDIEKSTDAVTFTKIGFTQGAGNAVTWNRYTFYDTNFHGSAYYRLRQVDYDGSFTYSNTIFINSENNTSLALHPVPAEKSLTAEFICSADNEAILTIENHFGQQIKNEIISAKAGLNTFTTEVSNLQSGIYILRISTLNDSFVKKFVKN